MSIENNEDLEDLALSLIAELRDTEDAKTVSHEDAWKSEQQDSKNQKIE